MLILLSKFWGESERKLEEIVKSFGEGGFAILGHVCIRLAPLPGTVILCPICGCPMIFHGWKLSVKRLACGLKIAVEVPEYKCPEFSPLTHSQHYHLIIPSYFVPGHSHLGNIIASRVIMHSDCPEACAFLKKELGDSWCYVRFIHETLGSSVRRWERDFDCDALLLRSALLRGGMMLRFSLRHPRWVLAIAPGTPQSLIPPVLKAAAGISYTSAQGSPPQV